MCEQTHARDPSDMKNDGSSKGEKQPGICLDPAAGIFDACLSYVVRGN